jgi:SanA protein
MKTFRNILQVIFHLILYLAVGGFLITSLLRVGMLLYARPHTFLVENSPEAPVALVLGAGLNRDGSPGIVLRDRVSKAADLYFSGKVEKLLMSGDNSTEYYNEPGAMKEYALSLNIPEEDIIIDYAGRRTYDSCYRANAIFDVNHLVVVTQAYHLPRALFLCNSFDITASGVPADESEYHLRSYSFWWFREVLASLYAYWDVYIAHPQPILGEPEPIFP